MTMLDKVAMRVLGIFMLCGWLIVACGPQPTPYPVDLPVTPTVSPFPTEMSPVRYAMDANTQDYIAEYALIAGYGRVEQLTEAVNLAELGTRYDVVAAYGVYEGWQRSPGMLRAVLAIASDSGLTPQIADILRRAVDAPGLAESLAIPGVSADAPGGAESSQVLRTELANLGMPDGLHLVMAYTYLPGAAQLAAQLAQANIEVTPVKMTDEEARAALAEGQAHLALVAWHTQEARERWETLTGTEYVLELYTLPISYLALPELTITFTSGGWPIASR